MAGARRSAIAPQTRPAGRGIFDEIGHWWGDSVAFAMSTKLPYLSSSTSSRSLSPALRLLTSLALLSACNGDDGDSAASASSTSVTVTATASESGTESATASASEAGSDTEMSGSNSATEGTGTTEASATDGSASASSSTTGPTTTDPTEGSESDSTTNVIPPNCGDGVVDDGEQCDDGDANGIGEACNPDCTENVCGDGIESPFEECDIGDENGPDGACSAMCTINPSSCGVQEYEAMLEVSPVDIIIVIDNSGSMGGEIKGVQDNININFAAIIEDSGLDYRVILVSEHGKYNGPESICVEAPLSGIEIGGCVNPPPQPVNNPGKFYHYSVPVSSHNAWCRLIDGYDGSVADQYNFAPNGWSEWLREDSLKTFIAISDDGSSCGPYNDGNNVNSGNNAAVKFDADLQTLSPLHFGDSPETRNYFFYSIVGMSYNNPQTEPYTPKDPIITGECPGAADPGTGHQAMSNLTDALRFPLCDTTSYDVIFKAIAEGVIKGAKIACEFPIPEPPENKTLDLESILLEYSPMGVGDPETYDQVPGIDQCGPKSFYIADGLVHLCPSACEAVQSDKDAKIDLKFSCEPIDPG